jgi:hypothetical protein
MWVTSIEDIGEHSPSGPRVVRVAIPGIVIMNRNGGFAYSGCVPRYVLRGYLLRPKLLTAHVWFALQEELRMQIVKQYEGFHTFLMHVILYRIMCTDTELFSDTDSAYVRNCIVMSWYFPTFKSYKKIFGDGNRHNMFIISPNSRCCYVLEKIFSGKMLKKYVSELQLLTSKLLLSISA